jgi:single-strand DNA-binding protein
MVNRVILVGRLGADPEVRYTQDGTMVTTFRMATDEQWKDKSGNREQRTEWHRVVTYRKLAEICGEYLAKGSMVFIEGRIQTRSWTDKEGNKRFSTEIIAQNMKMLDRKGKEGAEPQPEFNAAEPHAPDDDVPF